MKNDKENVIAILPDISFKGGYRSVYRQAQDFYKHQWRGQEKGMPAFKGDVIHITNKFFKHIVGKIAQQRYVDVLQRLRHIPNAKAVVENIDDIFEYRFKTKTLIYCTLLGHLENGRLLRVVVADNLVTGKKSLVTVYEIQKQIFRFYPSGRIIELEKKLASPISKHIISYNSRISATVLQTGQIKKDTFNLLLEIKDGIVLVKVINPRIHDLKIGQKIMIVKNQRLKSLKAEIFLRKA